MSRAGLVEEPFGSPLLPPRFWQKVAPNDAGCWIWTGTRTPRGYGQFSINNKHTPAHRTAYIALRGEITPGLHCDHLCRVRECVNPYHIEPVTNRENLARGIGPSLLKARNSAITNCPSGHEYTPDNTRIDKKGSRNCRTCHVKHYKAHRAKTRALAERMTDA